MKEKQGPRIPTMYGPAIYRINESTQKNQNDNRRLAGPRRTDATRLLRKIETLICRSGFQPRFAPGTALLQGQKGRKRMIHIASGLVLFIFPATLIAIGDYRCLTRTRPLTAEFETGGDLHEH